MKIAFEQGTPNSQNRFSFYRTRYLESAVNVLTNTPKIPNFNNVYMFQIFYSQSDEKK